MNIGFEIIVYGQILPDKKGLSDLRSPNSQIQFRYTPNTMPIKDCIFIAHLGGANPAVNTPRPSRGVCVLFPSILDIKWTYQPGSHRRKVTQDF